MGHLGISSLSQSEVVAFPKLAGVTAEGGIETRGVVSKPGRPILLWAHAMEPGATLRWRDLPVGHLLFVWTGDATLEGGDQAKPRSAVVAEQNSAGLLRAGPEGALVLHFHETEDDRRHVGRAGGHVHLRKPEDIFTGVNKDLGHTYRLWADATCDTCEIWLSGVEFAHAREPRGLHHHNEDEIIFIIAGEMIVGRRKLPAGTALAIDAETTYLFGVGDEGLSFINFRACEPYYIGLNPDRSLKPAEREYDTFMSTERVPGY